MRDREGGRSNLVREASWRLGVKALGLFALVATAIAWVSAWSLALPGGPVDIMWRLKPQARLEFQHIGPVVVVGLTIVGFCCLATGIGLLRSRPWARWLAIVGLAINGLGDLTKAFTGDPVAGVVGAAIAGLLVAFLLSRRVGQLFAT